MDAPITISQPTNMMQKWQLKPELHTQRKSNVVRVCIYRGYTINNEARPHSDFQLNCSVLYISFPAVHGKGGGDECTAVLAGGRQLPEPTSS